MQEERDEEIHKIRKTFNVELESIRLDNKSLIDNLNNTHTDELQKIKLLHHQEILNRSIEIEEANKLKLEQINENSNILIIESVKKAVDDVQKTHENLIFELRKEYQEILNQLTITEQKNLVLKVGEIKKIYTEHEENSIKSLKLELSNNYLNEIASNNEEFKAVHQNEISELNMRHEERLKNKLNENEINFAFSHAEKINNVISEMEEKYETEIKNIQIEHNKETVNKQLEYEIQIKDAVETAIASDRDDINKYYENATTELKEKTTSALHLLHTDLTLKHTTAVAHAVAENKREYENKIVILIENNIQNIKNYEEKEKNNEEEHNRELNEVRTQHELQIKNLLEEHSKNKNSCIEEEISNLNDKNDKIVKKLYLGYQAKLDEMSDALVAEEEHSLVKMEEKEIENEKKINILLSEQNATLCESHKIQLLQQLKEMRDTLIAEHNTIINELKDKTDNEHSIIVKDIIESFGKKGRDNLETQRSLFRKERSADLEKSKEELRLLTIRHTTEISTLKSVLLKSHQKQLSDMKNEMENTMKVTLREREKAADRAVEASSVLSYTDKEITITNMRSQHVRRR